MKTYPSGPFAGINNRLPDTKLRMQDAPSFVRNAVNVDLTSAGSFRRRAGAQLQLAGVDCHSFWSQGAVGFFVDGSTLYRVTGHAAGLTKAAIATVTPGLRMSFSHTGIDVRASNGTQALRISDDGTVADWVVPTPRSQPTLTAGQGGSLPAGIMRACISYVDAAGEEGGTTFPVAVEVSDNGVLTVSNIEHEAGYTTTLYITQPNDDQFFKVAEPTGSTVTISIKPVTGPRPVGLLLAPLPAGHIVRYANGRLLVAAGNMLYYSDVYHLGLYNPSRNYIPFPSPITMIEPCQNGFYLSADQTYWVDGDVASADLNPVLPYKAIAGTSASVPNTNSVWWMSERGVVVGTQDGQVQNLQEKNVAVEPATVGASLFREQDGMKQMVSSLFSPQSTVVAASSWLDAEIIRKETVL